MKSIYPIYVPAVFTVYVWRKKCNILLFPFHVCETSIGITIQLFEKNLQLFTLLHVNNRSATHVIVKQRKKHIKQLHFFCCRIHVRLMLWQHIFLFDRQIQQRICYSVLKKLKSLWVRIYINRNINKLRKSRPDIFHYLT